MLICVHVVDVDSVRFDLFHAFSFFFSCPFGVHFVHEGWNAMKDWVFVLDLGASADLGSLQVFESFVGSDRLRG